MIEAAVRRRGARIVSAAGEGTEGDGPTDVLMRRIVDAFAEYERLVIKARTKAALQVKKARGERRSGRLPYGTELAGEEIPSYRLPCELAVLETIKELRAGGLTLQAIASEFERPRHPAARGGASGNTAL